MLPGGCHTLRGVPFFLIGSGGVTRSSLNRRIDEPKLFMASGRAAHLARAQLAVNNFAARVKFERLPHEFNHHSHEEC